MQRDAEANGHVRARVPGRCLCFGEGTEEGELEVGGLIVPIESRCHVFLIAVAGKQASHIR